MELLRATLAGYLEHIYIYRDFLTDYIPFSVPTAERKAAVETALMRRLSQRPNKDDLENRGILKSKFISNKTNCICVPIRPTGVKVYLFVVLNEWK